MLNVSKAWQFSTGNGVTVALIDTGVTPGPRLPVIAGGDYVMGGDGLSDCDAHGTIVASVITAAPSAIRMPAPLPPNPPRPALPAAPAIPPDGVAGVAPHATLISIRQSSRAFEPVNPGDGGAHRKAGTVATLARAVVHAANTGAEVINVSVAACVSAADNHRWRTVGIMCGFYVTAILAKLVGRLSGPLGWVGYLSVLNAYEPQQLVGGGPEAWRLLGWYDGTLLGIGLIAYAVGAVIFSRRDLPAPL
jgi:membrane-anchored mycosin MYCP